MTHVTVEEARAMSKRKPPPLCDSFAVAVEPVSVHLPWPPTVNTYWRHHVVCGHVGVYLSKAAKVYRRAVVADWLHQAGRVTFDGRIAVRIEAVFPDNRPHDLDNLCKATLDALQAAGAYRDDSQIALLIVENDRVEKPGWLEVKVGPKPGVDSQRNLFSTDW